MHTGNIFNCLEWLKLQKVAFHFLRQCLYTELPNSFKYSACWQWSFGQITKCLTSMIFSCKSFSTSFIVSSSRNLLWYPTKTYALGLVVLVRYKIYDVELTKLWLMTSSQVSTVFISPTIFPPSSIFPSISILPSLQSLSTKIHCGYT